MKVPPNHDGRRAAFTLIELLVVMAIISILASMLMPSIARAKAQAQRIKCVSNQRQIMLGFTMWADDHTQKFPWQLLGNAGLRGNVQIWRDFDAIQDYAGSPQILVCPAGRKTAALDYSTNAEHGFGALRNSSLSYFLGVEATMSLPMMHIIGDENIFSQSNNLACVPGGVTCGATRLRPDNFDKPAWDWTVHVAAGNMTLVDGSVQRLSQTSLQRHLGVTGSENLDNCVIKPSPS